MVSSKVDFVPFRHSVLDTGKTSYTLGLAQKLGIPAYEILREEENTTSKRRAGRSWEISQTNEFLTQMERFQGILLCTTDRFEL